MWLIDVNTLKLHEFVGSRLLWWDYAILSHTWGDEEVTFGDMQQVSREVRSKKGFSKITNAAKQAKRDGFWWVWVDTCCIDKTNSAELSEAINSMYMWYQRSEVCYVYLADVDSFPSVEEDDTMFQRSRWFTRGWTLQELVAPETVDFYSKDWVRIGEKRSPVVWGGYPSLRVWGGYPGLRVWGEKGRRSLCKASGVPQAVLFDGRAMEQYSVAQRMAWASNRDCTRIEDTAYCLLGLFGINMPLLYGEEEKAFARLQEEIIKATDDHSIYAWTIPQRGLEARRKIGRLDYTPYPILARSPSYFENCSSVVAAGREDGELSGLTKHGLRMQVQLERGEHPVPPHMFHGNARKVWAPLNCRLENDERPLGLLLLEIESSDLRGGIPIHCYRIGTAEHLLFPGRVEGGAMDSSLATVYIRQRLQGQDVLATRDLRLIWLPQCPLPRRNLGSQTRPRFDIGPSSGLEGVGKTGFSVTVVSSTSAARWSPTFGSIGCEMFPCSHVLALSTKGLSQVVLIVLEAPGRLRESPIKLFSVPARLLPEDRWHEYEQKAGEASEGNLIAYESFPCSTPKVRLGTYTVHMKLGCEVFSSNSDDHRIYSISFHFEHEAEVRESARLQG